MSRASFLGLLAFACLIAGLGTLHGVLLALTIPILVYWAYGLWRAPDTIDLRTQRELDAERVIPNTPVRVRLTIFNAGDDLDELALEDVVPPGLEVAEGSTRHLISLSKGGSFSFEYTVRASRGNYPFESIRAQAGDALGLFPVARAVPTRSHLLVLPSIVRVKAVPIRPRRTRVYAGAIPARAGGTGVEFFGVRPYLPGESARRINWHASARHIDDLYSNEFQQERVADVAVVLDGRERSNLHSVEGSLFEHSILAAGTIANALLYQGNRVGLLVYSHFLQWTMPGYGRVQRERILHALAGAVTGASQIFEGMRYLPARLFPAESQIILVSPLLEDDAATLVQLRARGYQVMVVSPDPVGFEAHHLPRPSSSYSAGDARLSARIVRLERAAMFGRVRRAGVQVIEWDVSQPFDQVLRRAFTRLTRTGARL